METIIAAAVVHKGKVYQGKRHGLIIHEIVKETGDRPITGEQGFVTSTGRFVSREDAAVIALKRGQIKKLKFNNTQLFSEDLW